MTMPSIEPLYLSHLPQEIIELILSCLNTKDLCRVAPTSQYIHSLVCYLIFARVRNILAIEQYSLIYECYLPFNKFSAPYHHSTYLKTCPLRTEAVPEQHRISSEKMSCGRLYTHFHPWAENIVEERAGIAEPDRETASTTISLEIGEYFTQICSMGLLVKQGPRQGLFTSVIPIFETYFRLRREWLDQACKSGERELKWIGIEENVGLVLTVKPVGRQRPILMQVGEEDEVAASFEVHYHEIVVRTAHLLSVIEQDLTKPPKTNNAMMLSFTTEASESNVNYLPMLSQPTPS